MYNVGSCEKLAFHNTPHYKLGKASVLLPIYAFNYCLAALFPVFVFSSSCSLILKRVLLSTLFLLFSFNSRHICTESQLVSNFNGLSYDPLSACRALSETTASENRGEADAAFLFLSSFSALLQSHGSRCCCPSLCPSKYIICDSRAIRCKFVGRVNAHFSRRCLDLAI